jgi:hypothetical protein
MDQAAILFSSMFCFYGLLSLLAAYRLQADTLAKLHQMHLDSIELTKNYYTCVRTLNEFVGLWNYGARDEAVQVLHEAGYTTEVAS